MTNYTAQAVWNFDADELQTISNLKKLYVDFIHAGNLEDTYWVLRLMWGEIDAKLDTKGTNNEMLEAEGKMESLELSRNDFLSGKIQSGDFFLKLETFYRYLCRKMKEHGLYFREGDDPTRAVFRR